MSAYPGPSDFAKLLNWHLESGTRPDGALDRPGRRWSNKQFADSVGGVSERTVRNWRTVRSRPNDLDSIERALFGQNRALDSWRMDLRTSHDRNYDYGKPSKSNISSGIPKPTPYFIGRSAEYEAVSRVLLDESDSVAVLVQGAPGLGKTTLTQAVGNRPDIIERFGDANRWFVPLDTTRTAVAMRDAIGHAIGTEPTIGFQGVIAQLRRSPGLLILDNLETPWDPLSERRATEDILAELADVPGMALLASFRGRERISGPSWASVVTIAGLDQQNATELFRRIAQQSYSTDLNLPRLIAALGGIPLAIELVATHAYSRDSLAVIWDQWTRVGTAIATHPEYSADRLTSLSHSIELSLKSERMTLAALHLYRILGQLPAGLHAEDRDALFGEAGFDAEEVLLRVGLAVERNGRLDLLPPIRDHAARYHPPEMVDSVVWSSHYLELVRRFGGEIGTKTGAVAASRLLPEFANIEASIRLALATGRGKDVMASHYGLSQLTYVASLSTPVFWEMAASCRTDGDELGEAICIRSLGDIALVRADFATARAAYEQALPIYSTVGSVLGEANCILRLSDIALAEAKHGEARLGLQHALTLYRQMGSILGEADCISSMGGIAFAEADYAEALSAYEHALRLYRQIASLLGEASCMRHLADIAHARSDHSSARSSLEQAMQLYRQGGYLLGEAQCISSLGDIAFNEGDHAAARTLYEQALLLYRKIASVVGEADSVRHLDAIARAEAANATD